MKLNVVSVSQKSNYLFCFSFVVCLLLFMAVAKSSAQQSIKRIDGTKISSDSLTKYLPELMHKGKVAGLGMTIFNQNHIVYKETFGYSRADQKKALKSTTNIYGASLSKSVFAVLVMKLVEQGKLDLDKPLQQYLPKPIYEYKHQKRWHDDFSSLKGDTLYTKITARMCLDHTTGFANWRWDMADQKLRVLQIPLIHSFLLLNRIIVWDTMKRAGFTRKIKIMKHDRQVHSKLL